MKNGRSKPGRGTLRGGLALLLLTSGLLLGGCKAAAPVPGQAYAITWQWDAPLDAPLGTTYNLYCGVNGGTAALMNTAGAIAGLSFTEQNAIAGATYSCYARAVENGVESTDSNIAVTVVP
jgi:hypothetical protein